MLKTNLSILLAQRDLRITKVAEDTGISRTTLTALSSNSSQGIQFDTLNKLCTYLQTTPEQFFSFVPYEVDIRLEKAHEDAFLTFFIVTEKNKRIELMAYLSVYTTKDQFYSEEDGVSLGHKISSINIEIELSDPSVYEDEEEKLIFEKENKMIIKYLSQIPISLKREVESKITSSILWEYSDDLPPKKENIDIYISWPTELL